MRPFLRALVLVAVVALPAFPISALAATSPDPTLSASAERTLSQCLGRSNRLEVVFLLDESQSVAAHDPTAQRVAGVKAALAALNENGARSVNGVTPVIDVLFASFAQNIDPDPFAKDATTPAWRALSPDTLAQLQQQAQTYETRDHGHDTDYLKALQGARELLQQRAFALTHDGGPSPCRLLVWFTDGRYEVTEDPQSVPAGVRQLCRPGGVIDQLRGDDVVTLTLGLRSKSFTADDESLLRALTDGTRDADNCASRASSANGIYQPIGNASQLFLTLSDLLRPIRPPEPPPICVSVRCPEGLVRFAMVRGVTRFVIRATTGAPDIQVDLAGPVGPSARFVPLATNPVSVGGAQVSQNWASPVDVTLSGQLNSPSGTGDWTMAFVDPDGTHRTAQADYRIKLLADVGPVPARKVDLVRGETVRLPFAIKDSRGADVDSGPLIDHGRLDVTYTDPIEGITRRARTRALGGGRFEAAITMPADSPTQSASVDASLSFAAPPGIAVIPHDWHAALRVKYPPDGGYPEVTPAQLDLPAIKDDGTVTRYLGVVGSRIGGGCIWFPGANRRIESDGGAMQLTVGGGHTSRATCLQVQRSQRLKVPVTVSVAEDDRFTGHVNAAVNVALASETRPGSVGRVQVEAAIDVAKSPNRTLLWVLFAALAVAAMAIPLALLLLSNRWIARFTPEDHVQARFLRVRLRRGERLNELDADGEESAPDVRPRTFSWLSASARNGGHRKRALELEKGIRLRTVSSFGPRARWSGPFLGPYGIAEVDGRRVISGTDRTLSRYHDAAEVPLGLPGTWIFYPTKRSAPDDRAGGALSIEGELVLLASGGREQEGAELLASAERGIADLWHEPVSGTPSRRRGRLSLSSSIRERLRQWPRSRHEDDVDAPRGADDGDAPPRRTTFLS